jgi:hypothetical protein
MGYENHLKHISMSLKSDPVKLHAHIKDNEYNQDHEMAVSNQQRERELKLRTDEEGYPFAVRSCIQQRDGSVKWNNMDDSICRDEVSMNFNQTDLKLV